jgi:hypothetical protein
VLKRFQKQVLKARLETKETAYNFRKIPCGHSKGIFSDFGRFFEDYLRNLTCWEKSKISKVKIVLSSLIQSIFI